MLYFTTRKIESYEIRHGFGTYWLFFKKNHLSNTSAMQPDLGQTKGYMIAKPFLQFCYPVAPFYVFFCAEDPTIRVTSSVFLPFFLLNDVFTLLHP